MEAIVPDKRKKQCVYFVCVRCTFPEISVVGECGGKGKKIMAWAAGPASEEEALALGWVETENGVVCPICAGQLAYEATIDAQDGSESHVGAGGMVTALAKEIAEVTGEGDPGRVTDEQVKLPTVHLLGIKECPTDPKMGTAVCTRCSKNWSWVKVGNDFETTPSYSRDCIAAPSNEHLPPPATEKINE